MSEFYFDNAIAWGQFQLKGGWRATLVVALGFSALVAATIMVFYQLCDTAAAKRDCLDAAVPVLRFINIFVLLIFGTTNISSAIRNDLTTRQIESHRLMPLPAFQAVTGYVTSVALRMGIVYFCSVMIGLVVCDVGSHSSRQWLISSASLLIFSGMCWAIVALLAFMSRWAFFLAGGAIYFILAVSWNAGAVFAGFFVISGGMRDVLFNVGPRQGLMPIDWMLFSTGLQMALAMLCMMAAAGKYSRDDRQGLPFYFSLGVLLIWVIASAFGIHNLFDAPFFFGGDGYDHSGMEIGTFIVSLLAGMLGMSSLAWGQFYRDQHRRIEAKPKVNWPWRQALGLLMCVVLIVSITLVSPDWNSANAPIGYQPRADFTHPRLAVELALVAAIALFQCYALMRIFYGWVGRPNMLTTLCVGFIWIIPLVIDSIYDNSINPNRVQPMDLFSLASPIGWMIGTPQLKPGRLTRGIAAQFAILMLLAGVMFLVNRIRFARARRGFVLTSLPGLD